MLQVGVAAAVLIALSPVGALATGQPNSQNGATSTTRTSVRSGGSLREVADVLRAGAQSDERLTPDGGAGWRYLVNGQPTVVRAVGYNPEYAHRTPRERETLY